MTALAVIGSANLDQTARVARLPRAGETLLATTYEEGPGGKGLNQALAAARSTDTALIAAVGSDAAAEVLLDAARAGGVVTEEVVRLDGASGRALIAVEESGQNHIVVVAGANAELGAAHVRAALGRLRPGVVLVQSEVPPDAEDEALRWAGEHGARVVWNRSPVRATDPALLALADPVVVNEEEALALAEALGTDPEGLAHCCGGLVTTLGERGATWSRAGTTGAVEAPPVTQVVDTVGAGDEVAGTLAAALHDGCDLPEALQMAVRAASAAVAIGRERRRARTTTLDASM